MKQKQGLFKSLTLNMSNNNSNNKSDTSFSNTAINVTEKQRP